METSKAKKTVGAPLVKDIYQLSDEALSQLKTWFEQAGISVPISQLVGKATIPATPTAQELNDALVALGLISNS